MEYMKDGGNTPTNPELWSRAKAAAKAKYDVYPSAYANGYAAKWYKERGGGWKKAEMGGTLCYECGGMYDFGGTFSMPFMQDGGMPIQKGEPDGSMALTQINAMLDRLNNLKQVVSPNADLDPWISDKLSVMNHSATAINDYMQYGEEGQPKEEMMEMAQGGGIPERYKNMGFTKVGVKKQSTSAGKKWMVLAKKGDQYKVVHGGYDGMKDYTQHGSENRRERFWDRMGGRDSAKAKDPFSPLYWHKRFGTWEEGGELPEMQDAGTTPDYESMIQAGDHTVDTTYKRQLNNLENNKWNRGLAITNSLVDPRSPIHMLPDKGFGSGLKALAGIASAGAGTILGYEKMFAKDKTERTLYNNETGEYGKREDVLKARYDKSGQLPVAPVKFDTQKSSTGSAYPFGMSPEFMQQIKSMPAQSNMTPTGGSGMGAMESQNNYNIDQPMQTTPAATPTTSATTPAVNTNPTGSTMQMPAIPAGLENFMMGVQQKRNGGLIQYFPGGPFPQSNQSGNFIEQMLQQQSGQTGVGVGDDAEQGSYAAFNKQGTGNPNRPQYQQDWSYTERGDAAGFVAANNALTGLGMANNVLGQKNQQKQYDKRMMEIGNTDAMYNAVNPSNPYGNYTTNVGIGPNFALVRQTAAQDFSDANLARYGGTMRKQYREGGSYMVSDRELMEILANGGDVEFL
jgi:hypothetical protein